MRTVAARLSFVLHALSKEEIERNVPGECRVVSPPLASAVAAHVSFFLHVLSEEEIERNVSGETAAATTVFERQRQLYLHEQAA